MESLINSLRTLLAVAVGSSTFVYAQISETKVVAADAALGDRFGWSVSISGSYAIVGAMHDDIGSNLDQGSAYILRQEGETWVEDAKLVASDGRGDQQFGFSVAVWGDLTVVGAPRDNDNGHSSGSAYVFRQVGSAWVEEAKLTASDGARGDLFGSSVAISGDRAIVGAWGHDDNGPESGCAYLFSRNGAAWVEESHLLPGDGAEFDFFGGAVALDGEYAVIGAWGDDDNGFDSGSAYVFRRDSTSWAEEAKLVAGDGELGNYFGNSVSLRGTSILVGARFDGDGGFASGSAYIFERGDTGWVEEAKLTAHDGSAYDEFAYSVSIAENYAAVGAFHDNLDDDQEWEGSAYIFKRVDSSWAELVKVRASDRVEDDWFGYAVSIDGERATVGVWRDPHAGTQSGSVYVYSGFSTITVPVAPTLVSPANNVSNQPTSVPLVWRAPPFATSYRLQVATDPAFASGVVVDDSTIVDTANVVSSLFDSTTYFWRVNARNALGVGEWSETWAFSTVSALPDPVCLLLPFNGATAGGEEIDFVWCRAHPWVDAYWFEISSDSLFVMTVVDSTISDTTTTISQLLNRQTYWWMVRARNAVGWGPFSETWSFTVIITAVEGGDGIPRAFNLNQNYPNPFNPATVIRYGLPRKANVRLEVFTVLGQRVRVVVDEEQEAGYHEARLDGTDLASGVYVYRLVTGNFTVTRKMLVLR